MNKEEFKKQKQIILDIYNTSINELNKKFALENNKVKIGDIIKSGRCNIKVDKIEVKQVSYSNFPECRYTGKKVKKDGSFFKDGSSDFIYQCNLKK